MKTERSRESQSKSLAIDTNDQSMLQRFNKDGFVVFRHAVEAETISLLREEVERLRMDYQFTGGLRRLTLISPRIAEFVSSDAIHRILRELGLGDAFLVRSILFDKTPGSNWKVAWHQDTKIPVAMRIPIDGYTAWSVKEGVVHVQPPAQVLAGMRTLRLHLDDTPKENGALRVAPGSHSNGFVNLDDIDQFVSRECTCECAAGDILAMSPLLLHASSPAIRATRRRVIHLEFANTPLRSPLECATA